MTDESQFLVNTVPGSQYRFLSSCIPRCGAKKIRPDDQSGRIWHVKLKVFTSGSSADSCDAVLLRFIQDRKRMSLDPGVAGRFVRSTLQRDIGADRVQRHGVERRENADVPDIDRAAAVIFRREGRHRAEERPAATASVMDSAVVSGSDSCHVSERPAL